ncbi:MAG: hypothetical protein WD467_02480 [Candidatus Saccharimonadales bacterium]
MLGLHIIGGTISFGAVLYGLVGLARHRVPAQLMWLLPLLAGWQLLSGIGLVLSGGSWVRICGSGSIYLVVMGLLYLRLRQAAPGDRKALNFSNQRE